MEHLLQKSKCSISNDIFKYMIFQRHQKALLWSKGLNNLKLSPRWQIQSRSGGFSGTSPDLPLNLKTHPIKVDMQLRITHNFTKPFSNKMNLEE